MKAITTKAEFLVYALAIEEEASERYAVFADQMETTNNPEVAGLFRKMEQLENEHAREIEKLIAGANVPHINPWELDWGDDDPPEAVDFSDTHYLMTPHQALSLVLKAEKRAVKFFSSVAKGDVDEDVKRLASEFAEEEREHVAWVKKWRKKYPRPDEDWAEDMDPPNALE